MVKEFSNRFKKRQGVYEKFSTLLEVTEDSSGQLMTRWQLIPSLANNMHFLIQLCANAGIPASYISLLQKAHKPNPDPQVTEWDADAVIRALQISLLQEARKPNPNPLAAEYLYASLQECIFWAGQNTKVMLLTQGMSKADCIQLAQQHARFPVAILRKYNPSRGRSVESYAQLQITSAVNKTVYKGNEAALFSDWGLLFNNISERKLRNGLQNAGITEPLLSQCVLAWQCFREKEIYAPTRVRRRRQEPLPEQLTAFAERYNRRSLQEPALSGDDIKTLLKTCIDAVRASKAEPLLISRDAPGYLEEEHEYPNNEHLRPPNPEISQEQAEQEEQWQQLRAVLAEAIEALQESVQTMLLLWHGLGLKQADIGRAMSLKQYQVSRELDRYKRLLLKALAEWSENQLGIELSLEKINELQGELNEWLEWYCRSPFHNCLQTTLKEELRDEIPLLKRYYGQGLSHVEVASELNLDATIVNQRLEQVKQHLQSRLYNWVQDTHNLSPDALNSAAKPIAALVEEWLTNATYSSFEI